MNLALELASVLNRYSQENASDTPDYILAAYLLDCLEAYNRAVNRVKDRNSEPKPVAVPGCYGQADTLMARIDTGWSHSGKADPYDLGCGHMVKCGCK